MLEQQKENGILTPRNTVYLQSVLNALSTDPQLHRRAKELIDGLCYYVFLNENREETFLGSDFEGKDFAKATKAAEWYQVHLPSVQVRVISDLQSQAVPCVRLEDALAGTIFEDMFSFPEAVKEPMYQEHVETVEARRRVHTGELLQGVFHVYRSDVTTGWVTVIRGVTERKEIVVEGAADINRAVEGDTVAVVLLTKGMDVEAIDLLDTEAPVEVVALGSNRDTKSQSGLKGKIVSVLKRRGKSYCGSVRATSELMGDRTLCLFSPINSKIPDVRVYCRNPNRYEGKRVTAVIDRWEVWSASPQGTSSKSSGT